VADDGKNGWAGNYRSQKIHRQANDGQAAEPGLFSFNWLLMGHWRFTSGIACFIMNLKKQIALWMERPITP
jgi:hypothetical protein